MTAASLSTLVVHGRLAMREGRFDCLMFRSLERLEPSRPLGCGGSRALAARKRPVSPAFLDR